MTAVTIHFQQPVEYIVGFHPVACVFLVELNFFVRHDVKIITFEVYIGKDSRILQAGK